MVEDNSKRIDASPTKRFFVEMLTRDIQLEQAVLDLLDNSVDGAKSAASEPNDLTGFEVQLEFGETKFCIRDNCGGFSSTAAKKYAFRFGRIQNAKNVSHSIGQFGVGMKRALFKFGDFFVVRSKHKSESWSVEVDVPDWELKPDWYFDWSDFGEANGFFETGNGTEVIVSNLHDTVKERFKSSIFENAIITLIQSKHRQFISQGLNIIVNGKHVVASDVVLLHDEKIQPSVTNRKVKTEDGPVNVRITAGLGISSPTLAGWYVICNGRVVLEADRSKKTGWGYVEEQAHGVVVPGYHNQFARFRGIVYFDAANSAAVPWNTTKNDVNVDSVVWQDTFPIMIEMMREVIDFLNELDRDIDTFTKEYSSLLQSVERSTTRSADTLTRKLSFKAPKVDEGESAGRPTRIQFSRPAKDVDFLKEELGVSSASAVGEATFDMIYADKSRSSNNE